MRFRVDKIAKSSNLTGWLLAAPLLAVLVVFLVFSVIMIVIVSFWQTTEFSIVPAFDLGNYEFLFGSADTYDVFLNTFKYAALTWPISWPFICAAKPPRLRWR